MPVLRASFRERLSPGRLLKQQLPIGPGIRLILFQGPELIPADRYNIPAQIPRGLPGIPGDYFPGPGQPGQQFPPGSPRAGFRQAPYPPLPHPQAGFYGIGGDQAPSSQFGPRQPPQGFAVPDQDGPLIRCNRPCPPGSGRPQRRLQPAAGKYDAR